MSNSSHIKLPLTDPEKASLRKQKIRISVIPDLTPEELKVVLKSTAHRARELSALAQFQTIPSLGVKFAEDMLFLGYYSLAEIRGKTGVELTDIFEKKQGFYTDPCVEDQFRLAAYVAETGDLSKKWWDFSKERKSYRLKHGYPLDRPDLSWIEMPEFN